MLDLSDRITHCVGALNDALGQAAALPLSCASRFELATLVCELQQVASRTEALTVAVAAAADDASVHVDAGVRNIESFVAAQANVASASVAKDRHLGRWLGQYQVVAEAFATGELTRRHVEDLRKATNTRSADAMAQDQHYLCRGAAAVNGGTNAPLIHLVMSEQVAEQALEWLHDPEAPNKPDTDPHDIDRRCEFVDGTPVHPLAAIGCLPAAVLRRLILTTESEILDLGTGTRCFPKHLREAILVAQRGRCANGCDAAAHTLHADQIQPHSRNGHTCVTNLQGLCPWCNGTKGDNPPLPHTDLPDTSPLARDHAHGRDRSERDP